MKALVPAWRANSISHNLFNEFDHMFDSFFDPALHTRLSIACDIEESEDFLLFSFDLPGMSEEDINIELNDSVLSVSGERRQEVSGDSKRRFHGRRHGAFKQSFRLPKNIDQEKIEADYSQGVLKVLLPKKEEARPKKVEVKAKTGGFLSNILGGKKNDE